MISGVETDENLCEKSISALDNSSSTLELLAGLLTRLHAKTELLTEATDLAQKNKKLLTLLVDSLESNLQTIMQNNN